MFVLSHDNFLLEFGLNRLTHNISIINVMPNIKI